MSCYFLEATAFAKLFVREPGSEALIRLMKDVEDNRRLIAGSTPLEIHAALRKSERTGAISHEDAAAALEILRMEATRTVQEPLNPAVLECASELLDRRALRWPDAVQLGAAMVAREMFQGTEIIFVSASQHLLEAARAEGLKVIDPTAEPEPDKNAVEAV